MPDYYARNNNNNLEEIGPRRCPRCGATMRRQVTTNGVTHTCAKCGYAVIERRGNSLSAEYRTERRRVKQLIERLISNPYVPGNCPSCGTPARRLKKKSTLAEGITYTCPKCKEVQRDSQSLECLNKLYELGNQYPDGADRDPIFHYLYIQILTYNFTEWNDKLTHHIDQLGRSAYDAEDQEEAEAYGRMFARLQFEHAVATGALKKCPVCRETYIKRSERMCDDCRERRESREYRERKTKLRKAIIIMIAVVALCATAFGLIYKFKPEWIFGESTIEYYIDGYKQSTTVSYSQNIEIDKPELTGYRFLGLYDNDVDGNMVVDANGKSLEVWSSKQNGGTVTLYPRWERIVYTIRLDVNGGSGHVLPEYTVEYEGTMPKLSADATRVGYDFAGWAIDKDGTRIVSDKNGAITGGKQVLIKENYDIPASEATTITLYAKYTPKYYEVTFDANGGTLNGKDSVNVAYDAIQIFGTPVREGYAFAGWYLGATAITDARGKMTSPWNYLENKELVAKWNLIYEVSFDTQTDIDIDSIYGCAGEVIKLPVATGRGYDKFLCWEYNGKSYTGTFEIPEGNVILTAKWNPAYEITFNTQTDISLDSVYGCAGETVTLPVATGREHDKFLCWEYNGKSYTDTFVMPKGNVTLTAKWNPAYKISFDTQTNVTIDSLYGCAGESVTLPSTYSTTRKYDTFVGWEYNGQTYKAGSFVVPRENATLKAQWDSNGWTYISTAKEFNKISSNLSGKYCLVADIDLGTGWTPMATREWKHAKKDDSPTNPFKGTLDGQDHTIYYESTVDGLKDTCDYGWGLFGSSKNAKFLNIVLDCKIKSYLNAEKSVNGVECATGGLVGFAMGSTFENCRVTSYSSIVNQDTDCTYYEFLVGMKKSGATNAGGLIGEARNCTITMCQNGASVYAGGYQAYVGGIVGSAYKCTVKSCSNSGALDANHYSWVWGEHITGAICGKTNNYWTRISDSNDICDA